MHTRGMLETHPRPLEMDRAALVACIEACHGCEQACTACADACLSEGMVQDLVHCIRLNLDCADACAAAGRILSRQTQPDFGVIAAQVEAMMRACVACGEECQRHAKMHEHCRICAESCRTCAEACNRLMTSMRQMAAA